MHKLILASQSPRRKQLLLNAGFFFTELPTQVSETPSKNLNPEDQIIELARRKASACLEQNKYLKSQDYLVLAADTEVIFQGQPMGKPENPEQARQFLRLLSGNSHQVITGICLINCKSLEQFESATVTNIYFKNLSEDEINSYVDSGEPFDKAGGYGIQGEAKKFIDRIEGPFDNVVGLPMDSVKKLIALSKVDLGTNLELGKSNFQLISDQIVQATHEAGRSPNSVRLVAVSKTKPTSQIEEVYSQGQREFGENYVQEFLEKQNYFSQKAEFNNISWHFIGHLQTNKVNQVVGKTVLIHSVDSLKLAQKLSRAAQSLNLTQSILLEVNVGGEQSKNGFEMTELKSIFSEIVQLPNLRLRGLMSLPPLTEDEQTARQYFKSIKILFDELTIILPDSARKDWSELSLGTTSDFKLAIQEGATIVRIGTAIFGGRTE